ncbi:hypothetical protein W97_09296 [Coniosporium apollinis CBS 100218]|uniref:Uncharacterized protein n=1 Tax=Coniosporium apollinis (strain CBS 100218) TaxID=1168221 RepID=R7Z7G7_CONA1|nr:uncharacterized protein W97_09296 [Coniosporium apollinis CBS 100218]EON70058.1 hypothetical protein W97_09296 [Coniosporium apollinis CBS 100218]
MESIYSESYSGEEPHAFSPTPEEIASGESERRFRFAVGLDDIPGEVKAFVRLNRLGRFNEAEEFFETSLQGNIDLFPVTAECADFLLEQGLYGNLSRFLRSQMLDREYAKSADEQPEEERHLLKLLLALSEIRTQGSLSSALKEARAAKLFLQRKGKTAGSLDEVEV